MKVRSQRGLFGTVIGTIRDVITRESEIEKIAKRLCANSKEDSCLSEKRKLIYDFFKAVLPEIDYKIKVERLYGQTVYYTDREGSLAYFTIGRANWYDEVRVGTKRIRLLCEADRKNNVKRVLFEYVHLIEFDKLINSETRDFAFTNMFGRKIEKAAEHYCLGEELDKKLRFNYLYKKTKRSFERAREEFEREKL